MNMPYRKLTALLIFLFIATTASAADELPVPFPWTEAIQFGYSGTGGNSSSSNIVGKFTSIYNRSKWTNTYKLDALTSSSGGTRSAERYSSSAEFNYNFKPQLFSFLRGSAGYDRFNSYDLTTIIATGFGKRLFANDVISVDAQIGPGYRSTRVAGSHTYYNGMIAFISSAFDWEVSDDADFQQSVNVEMGKVNTATISQTALSTTIVGNFDLELAFSIVHNSNIPPGTTLTANTDYRTDITLLYRFT
jgi:putative salt-induced outer membrane protein